MEQPEIVVYGVSNQRTNTEVMNYFERYGIITDMNITYNWGEFKYHIKYMSLEGAMNAKNAEDQNYWGNLKLTVYHGWSDQDVSDIIENDIETLGFRYHEDSN
jgi:hypothetical protein